MTARLFAFSPFVAGSKGPDRRCRRHYNEVWPHSAIGYRPLAPHTIVPNRADPPFAHDGLKTDRRSSNDRFRLN